VLRSWHPTTRSANLDPDQRWTRLEILSTAGGGLFNTEGAVEFRAHYRTADDQTGSMHEPSPFVREDGRWLYLDGSQPDRRSTCARSNRSAWRNRDVNEHRPPLWTYTDSRYITAGMSSPPLREPTFLVLTALAAGARHGYGIIKDVEAISNGAVRLRAGTLYAALERLCADSWVEVDHEEVVDGRRRRYYRLTSEGADRLDAEVQRLQVRTEVAARRLRSWTNSTLEGGLA
jgi:DNA-binding PadR family transcriptional regulator